MRFSDDWPIAPTLPTMIVITASVANAGAQVVAALDQRDVEEPQDHAEGRRLGGHRHEAGDRRGRALVDVRRPLVERRDRGLEGEARP